MSYADSAHQGLRALEKSNWEEAITKLSSALASSRNPAWLAARSRALINVGRFREALEDADLAWHEACRRNKREAIIDAHHRRAVAYNRLGELANADACCVYAMRMLDGGKTVAADDPAAEFTDDEGFWTQTRADAQREAQERQDSEKAAAPARTLADVSAEVTEKTKQWRIMSVMRLQILHKMDQLPADDPARKRTTTQKPPERGLADLGSKDKPASTKVEPAPSKPSAAPSTTAAPPPPPKDQKPRLQDFQSNAAMSVSIFSKGVDKAKLSVQFNPTEVILDPIVYPNGEQKKFTIATWGEIVPEECKYTVTPSKVELQLKKKSQGKWASLERQGTAEEAPTTQVATSTIPTQLKTAAPDAASDPKRSTEETKSADDQKPSKKARPSYPTSSRGGPKNWDNLDVDSDEEESDVNSFFKKLYKNATPEQQRAMMKSFTESSGTSLSTDWDDVKGRTVDAVPPEGVEAKKWE